MCLTLVINAIAFVGLNLLGIYMYYIYLRERICSFKHMQGRLALVFKKDNHDCFYTVEEAKTRIDSFNSNLKFEVRNAQL